MYLNKKKMDLFLLVFPLCLIGTVLCGEYCSDDGRISYCNYGCCGGFNDEHCCGMYSWIIALSVLGGFALLIFIFIVICVCKKQSMRKGRLIHNAPQSQVQTTTHVIHVPPPHQPPGYQHQPPGYQQHPPVYQHQPPVYQPQPQEVYPPPPPSNYADDPANPPKQ